MAFYQNIAEIGKKFIPQHKLFKIGFNLSPMYRRSTGRIIEVSEDLYHVKVKIPISMKNRNYVGSIFGGSMFSGVDPIPMVQLINIIGNDYVIWDKSAEIKFKKPARESLFADFDYTQKEIDEIINRVKNEKEIEIVKTTLLTDKSKETVFCEVKKTIYVADKAFYKKKKK